MFNKVLLKLLERKLALGIAIFRFVIRIISFRQWHYKNDFITLHFEDGTEKAIFEVYETEEKTFRRIKCCSPKYIRFQFSFTTIFGLYELGYITDEEMLDFWVNKNFDYNKMNKIITERMKEKVNVFKMPSSN